MASANGTLPPMGKISLIGIWIESVLYGVNCVFYGLCVTVLVREKKIIRLNRVLMTASTTLILFCTVHVGVSLRQLLDAFIYVPANVPDYSIIYWLAPISIPYAIKSILYTTLVLVQDAILIWRLYLCFMRRWKIIVIPVILLAGCVGSAYAVSSVWVAQNNASYFFARSNSLFISAWAFGFTLNMSVTGAIVARLWRTGQASALAMATSKNRFQSTIYIIIESGAISAVVNATLLGLVASYSPVALSGMDVAAQLVGLSPLLIIVQVDLYRTVPGSDLPIPQDEIRFRSGSLQDSLQDLPLRSTRSWRQRSV